MPRFGQIASRKLGEIDQVTCLTLDLGKRCGRSKAAGNPSCPQKPLGERQLCMATTGTAGGGPSTKYLIWALLRSISAHTSGAGLLCNGPIQQWRL